MIVKIHFNMESKEYGFKVTLFLCGFNVYQHDVIKNKIKQT